MRVTKRGELGPADQRRLLEAQAKAAASRVNFRIIAVEMMGKSSIREVARITGLSTNTLQKWKRET